MKKVVRKRCQVFDVHIINNEHMDKEDKIKFNDIPILQEFLKYFPKKDSRITSKKRIGFYY